MAAEGPGLSTAAYADKVAGELAAILALFEMATLGHSPIVESCIDRLTDLKEEAEALARTAPPPLAPDSSQLLQRVRASVAGLSDQASWSWFQTLLARMPTARVGELVKSAVASAPDQALLRFLRLLDRQTGG